MRVDEALIKFAGVRKNIAIVIRTKEGNLEVLAEQNFQSGLCDCCTKHYHIDRQEVVCVADVTRMEVLYDEEW